LEFLFVAPGVVDDLLYRIRPGLGHRLRRDSSGRRGMLPRPLWGLPCPGGPRGGLPAGNRAPARGVDVKPPPGPEFRRPQKPLFGVWSPFSPQNPAPRPGLPGTNSPKRPKMAIIPRFGVFLAISGSRSPFWAPAGVAFTSTPRGGALRLLFGGSAGDPAWGGISGSPGTGVETGPQGGPGDPCGRPLPNPAGDRAPARGVDVKPPPRGSPGIPGTGFRGLEPLPGA